MQILPILIAIVLGLLALAFVLYPFYRRSPADPKTTRENDALPIRNGHAGGAEPPDMGGAEPPPLLDTTERESEDAARAALREIELDYHLGNIEEADYRSLRERYMRRAIAALKARYERGMGAINLAPTDDAIEVRLQSLKEHHADTNDHAE